MDTHLFTHSAYVTTSINTLCASCYIIQLWNAIADAIIVISETADSAVQAELKSYRHQVKGEDLSIINNHFLE